MHGKGERIRGARWRAPTALAAAVTAGAAFAAFLTRLRDPDTFHHLALGREIVRRLSFPDTEPFLFPFSGVPVEAPQHWLGSVAIYGSHALLGDAGPVLLAAAVGAALAGLLLLDALDGERPSAARLAAAAAPLVLAALVVRPRAVARPELLGALLLASTLLLLRRRERDERAAIWPILLVVLVWANVHPSAAAGLAAVVAWLACEVVFAALRRWRPGADPEPGGAPRRPWRLAGFAVAAGAATLVTPSGAAPLRTAWMFALSLTGLRGVAEASGAPEPVQIEMIRHHVAELRALGAGDLLGPFGALVALCALALLAGRKRARLREVVTAAAFVALALSAQRFTLWAAVVLAPIAARSLFAALEAPGPTPAPARARWSRLRVPALAAACLALVAVGIARADLGVVRFGVGLERELFPLRAADYLASIGFRGRMFNTFEYGGYLEWRLGIPVFQDGRGMLHPEDVEAALPGPSDRDRFAELDGRYRFDALVLRIPAVRSTEEAKVLLEAAGGSDLAADAATFTLVAFDDGGLVYLRRDGAYGAFVDRDAYRLARPAVGLDAAALGDPETNGRFRSEMERALREAPACGLCRLQLARALLAAGAAREATRTLEPLLGLRGERDRFAHHMLAEAALVDGDRPRARDHLERAIATGIDPAPARTALAELELEDGRASRAADLVEANLEDGAREDDLALGARIAAARGAAVQAAALRRRAEAARLLSRGEALMASRQADRAAEVLGESLELDPSSPRAHERFGQALLLGGDPGGAVRALRRSVSLDGSRFSAWFALGLALEATGDRRGAADALSRSVSLEPRGPHAMIAERRLRALGTR